MALQPGCEGLPTRSSLPVPAPGHVYAETSIKDSEFLTPRQIRIAQQRRRKVKGRRQVDATEDSLPAAVAEYWNVQPRRDVGIVQRPQLREEVHVGRAAAQKDVLAVVYLLAGVGLRKGERPAAKEGSLLHQDHRMAAIGEVAGGGHPRQPSADNYYLPEALAAIPFAHSLAISTSFSRVLRLTLLPKTL